MGSSVKSAVKGVLNGVKWIIIVGGALFTIFVVVIVVSLSRSSTQRKEQRNEALKEQRERFRADMQKYFGLEESDYTIVKEYYRQESIYTYLVFSCGGEEYYYAENCTDYKTEWFCEDARDWLKKVFEKTEWFAEMETEVQKVKIGWKYAVKEENMLPLTCFEESADSFLSELLSDKEKRKYRFNQFYLTCEVQINASEIPDSPKELLQLKNTVPFLRTLTVHCYRVDPETQEKVFVKSYKVLFDQGEYVIYE
ncbi:MAG: hypothetical protein IKX54_05140 [Lachnospiraceae bacterium]|nr:hypothetical protein [Lachnospiraceae bacterium]